MYLKLSLNVSLDRLTLFRAVHVLALQHSNVYEYDHMRMLGSTSFSRLFDVQLLIRTNTVDEHSVTWDWHRSVDLFHQCVCGYLKHAQKQLCVIR